MAAPSPTPGNTRKPAVPKPTEMGRLLLWECLTGSRAKMPRLWDWQLLDDGLAGTYTVSGNIQSVTTIDETGNYSSTPWNQTITGVQNSTLTEIGSAGAMDYTQSLDIHDNSAATVLGHGTGSYDVTMTNSSSATQIENIYGEDYSTSLEDGATHVTVSVHFSANTSTGQLNLATHSTATYSGTSVTNGEDGSIVTSILQSSDTYSDTNSVSLNSDYYSLTGEMFDSSTVSSTSVDSSQTTYSKDTNSSDLTITDQHGAAFTRMMPPAPHTKERSAIVIRPHSPTRIFYPIQRWILREVTPIHGILMMLAITLIVEQIITAAIPKEIRQILSRALIVMAPQTIRTVLRTSGARFLQLR